MILWDIFQAELCISSHRCFPNLRSSVRVQELREVMSLQKAENKKADNEIAEENENAKRIELCPRNKEQEGIGKMLRYLFHGSLRCLICMSQHQ